MRIIIVIYALVLCNFLNCSAAQTVLIDSLDNHAVILDIDSLPYKVVVKTGGSEKMVYVDLENNFRDEIYFQVDTMPRSVDKTVKIEEAIVRRAILPRYYPPNERYRGVVSFIVEKNGAITNLRVVEGFERSRSKEIFPDLETSQLPEMLPGIKNGVPVPVEMRLEFFITSYGSIERSQGKRKK